MGGEYERLLRSIGSQSIAPDNVYVVLPHGFAPPSERLGTETYLYTDKGMWNQRIYGMEYCHSLADTPEYLLVTDDDVEFESDFAERLLAIAAEYGADTLIPAAPLSPKRAGRLFWTLMGERHENPSSPYRFSIRSNGRFSSNNSLSGNVSPTQSGCFRCFMMRTSMVPRLALREEMWLDETRYAWPDDQVFFYKAHLLGFKNYCCKSPLYTHLDGGAGSKSADRQKSLAYGKIRNAIIFWRRFVRPGRRTIVSLIGARLSLFWYIGVNRLYHLAVAYSCRDLSVLRAYNRGVTDGFRHPAGRS